MIKPDGVQRRVVGEIISRFESKGYHLKALKLTTPTPAVLEEHYKDLKAKSFFPKLMGYMSSGWAILFYCCFFNDVLLI